MIMHMLCSVVCTGGRPETVPVQHNLVQTRKMQCNKGILRKLQLSCTFFAVKRYSAR